MVSFSLVGVEDTHYSTTVQQIPGHPGVVSTGILEAYHAGGHLFKTRHVRLFSQPTFRAERRCACEQNSLKIAKGGPDSARDKNPGVYGTEGRSNY